MGNQVFFSVSGREVCRWPADGPMLSYTYPDQDPRIPEGMRKVVYLEPYNGENDNGTKRT